MESLDHQVHRVLQVPVDHQVQQVREARLVLVANLVPLEHQEAEERLVPLDLRDLQVQEVNLAVMEHLDPQDLLDRVVLLDLVATQVKLDQLVHVENQALEANLEHPGHLVLLVSVEKRALQDRQDQQDPQVHQAHLVSVENQELVGRTERLERQDHRDLQVICCEHLDQGHANFHT